MGPLLPADEPLSAQAKQTPHAGAQLHLREPSSQPSPGRVTGPGPPLHPEVSIHVWLPWSPQKRAEERRWCKRGGPGWQRCMPPCTEPFSRNDARVQLHAGLAGSGVPPACTGAPPAQGGRFSSPGQEEAADTPGHRGPAIGAAELQGEAISPAGTRCAGPGTVFTPPSSRRARWYSSACLQSQTTPT